MRPPPIVANPFPAQQRPWVKRCEEHGCRLDDDRCPICVLRVALPGGWTPAEPLAEVC